MYTKQDSSIFTDFSPVMSANIYARILEHLMFYILEDSIQKYTHWLALGPKNIEGLGMLNRQYPAIPKIFFTMEELRPIPRLQHLLNYIFVKSAQFIHTV